MSKSSLNRSPNRSSRCLVNPPLHNSALDHNLLGLVMRHFVGTSIIEFSRARGSCAASAVQSQADLRSLSKP